MTSKKLSDYEKMSVPERILVLQDLWDEISEDPDRVPVTQAQKIELDHRLARHRKSPDDVSSWPEVKMRIQAKK